MADLGFESREFSFHPKKTFLTTDCAVLEELKVRPRISAMFSSHGTGQEVWAALRGLSMPGRQKSGNQVQQKVLGQEEMNKPQSSLQQERDPQEEALFAQPGPSLEYWLLQLQHPGNHGSLGHPSASKEELMN